MGTLIKHDIVGLYTYIHIGTRLPEPRYPSPARMQFAGTGLPQPDHALSPHGAVSVEKNIWPICARIVILLYYIILLSHEIRTHNGCFGRMLREKKILQAVRV